jgi:hypothetical protein
MFGLKTDHLATLIVRPRCEKSAPLKRGNFLPLARKLFMSPRFASRLRFKKTLHFAITRVLNTSFKSQTLRFPVNTVITELGDNGFWLNFTYTIFIQTALFYLNHCGIQRMQVSDGDGWPDWANFREFLPYLLWDNMRTNPNLYCFFWLLLILSSFPFIVGSIQGDQVGWIFTYWAIGYFGAEEAHIWGYLFPLYQSLFLTNSCSGYIQFGRFFTNSSCQPGNLRYKLWVHESTSVSLIFINSAVRFMTKWTKDYITLASPINNRLK